MTVSGMCEWRGAGGRGGLVFHVSQSYCCVELRDERRWLKFYKDHCDVHMGIASWENLKVNGYTFRGNRSVISCLPPFLMGANSKRRE